MNLGEKVEPHYLIGKKYITPIRVSSQFQTQKNLRL